MPDTCAVTGTPAGWFALLFSFELCDCREGREGRCQGARCLAIFFWIMHATSSLQCSLSHSSGSCYFLLNYAYKASRIAYTLALLSHLLFSFELCPHINNLDNYVNQLLLAIFFWIMRLQDIPHVCIDKHILLFSFELCFTQACQNNILSRKSLLFSFELCVLVAAAAAVGAYVAALAIFFWIMRPWTRRRSGK